MWQPLNSQNQLHPGARLRQTVQEGNFQHEAIYKVGQVGDHFFMLETIERNGVTIPVDDQSVTPYSLRSVPYLGYEIWTE